MFIGTIDFYHFKPVQVFFTLAGGHKVSAKQNLLALFSHTLFKMRMECGMVVQQPGTNFLVSFVESREITAVLLTA